MTRNTEYDVVAVGGRAGGGMAETTWLDATAQADLVRRGEVSPKELAEAAIARIEAVNPRLDAVIRTRFDAARLEADGDLPDGPFRGVPILYKDVACTVAGEPNISAFLATGGKSSPIRIRSARSACPWHSGAVALCGDSGLGAESRQRLLPG